MKAHRFLMATAISILGSCTVASHNVAARKELVVMKQVSTETDPHRFLIQGLSGVEIHRPSPEHFRLINVNSDELIPLRIETDHTVPLNAMRNFHEQHLYHNQFWMGFRLHLQTSEHFLQEKLHEGLAPLRGSADLKHGQEYLLEWTAWPVGSKSGINQSLRFIWQETGHETDEMRAL